MNINEAWFSDTVDKNYKDTEKDNVKYKLSSQYKAKMGKLKKLFLGILSALMFIGLSTSVEAAGNNFQQSNSVNYAYANTVYNKTMNEIKQYDRSGGFHDIARLFTGNQGIQGTHGIFAKLLLTQVENGVSKSTLDQIGYDYADMIIEANSYSSLTSTYTAYDRTIINQEVFRVMNQALRNASRELGRTLSQSEMNSMIAQANTGTQRSVPQQDYSEYNDAGEQDYDPSSNAAILKRDNNVMKDGSLTLQDLQNISVQAKPGIYIQIASVKDGKPIPSKVFNQLKKFGIGPSDFKIKKSSNGWTKVLYGPYSSKAKAQSQLDNQHDVSYWASDAYVIQIK